jgi:Tol biopolymer transport system component
MAVVVAALALTAVAAQQTGQDQVQLRAAIKKESVDGDLKGAIAIYQQLRKSADRAVAAQALVRMGQCYEKLGAAESAEARKAYEEVVGKFADQAQPVADARARLAALAGPTAPARPVDQLVSTGAPDRSVSDVSRDGRWLMVYEGDYESVFVVDRTTGASTSMGKEDMAWGLLSPDGRQAAYSVHENGMLRAKVAAADGTNARVLAEFPPGGYFDPPGGYLEVHDWSADGRALLVGVDTAVTNSDIVAVTVADGSVRRLGLKGSGRCRWSPDGQSLAFTRQMLGPSSRIVVRAIASGEERDVPGEVEKTWGWDMHWLPDGTILSATMEVPDHPFRVDAIDPQTGQRTPLMGPATEYRWRDVAVANDGRAFYYSARTPPEGTSNAEVRIVRHDLATHLETTIVSGRSRGTGHFSLSLSPDGRFLAFAMFPEQEGGCPLWTLSLDGSRAMKQLAPTLDDGNLSGSAWTADGQFVMAVKDPRRGRPADVVLFPVAGGEPRPLGINLPAIDYLAVSADRRHLALVSGESTNEAWSAQGVLAALSKK